MTPSQLIAQARDLKPVPLTVVRLIGLLEQPDAANEDIVQLLRVDAVLTAKLLRMCNSSFFGFEQPVASVEEAVLMLGYQQILHIVFSLAFGGQLRAPLAGYGAERDELWKHSLVTALAAESLAQSPIPMDVLPPVAFTTGLLHDIGKLVLNQALTPAGLEEIRGLIARAHYSRLEAERDVLGADHAEVGACLLQMWRLPEDIVEAVAHHHAPEVQPRLRLSAVTHVADCLANMVGATLGWESFAVCVDEGALAALDITPVGLEGLMIRVHDSTQQMELLTQAA